MQKLGKGPLWLCHLSRSDLGHESSGDRTLQTGTLIRYLRILSLNSCEVPRSACRCLMHIFTNLAFSICLFPEMCWASWHQLTAHQFGQAPCGCQVQPRQKRPGLAIHLLLQEENRLMAGQAPTGWCRKDHILPLFWHYDMTYIGKRQKLVAYSSARQDLKWHY